MQYIDRTINILRFIHPLIHSFIHSIIHFIHFYLLTNLSALFYLLLVFPCLFSPSYHYHSFIPPIHTFIYLFIHPSIPCLLFLVMEDIQFFCADISDATTWDRLREARERGEAFPPALLSVDEQLPDPELPRILVDIADFLRRVFESTTPSPAVQDFVVDDQLQESTASPPPNNDSI